jgi:hypothetical protein
MRFVGWLRLTPTSPWRNVVAAGSLGECARKLTAYCRPQRLALPADG